MHLFFLTLSKVNHELILFSLANEIHFKVFVLVIELTESYVNLMDLYKRDFELKNLYFLFDP